MPFRLSVRGNVVYVSWRGFTEQELRDLAQRVAEERRLSNSRIIYLARIPAGGGAFTERENASLLEFVLEILPHCLAVHHVIEGGGFVRSARRAMLTNLARSTPRARDFYAHDSVEGAFSAIQTMHGVLMVDVDTTPPAAPAVEERASGAFRAAARTFDKKKDRKP